MPTCPRCGGTYVLGERHACAEDPDPRPGWVQAVTILGGVILLMGGGGVGLCGFILLPDDEVAISMLTLGVIGALFGMWLIPHPSAITGTFLVALGACSFVLVMVLLVAGAFDMAVMALIGGAVLIVVGLRLQRKRV